MGLLRKLGIGRSGDSNADGGSGRNSGRELEQVLIAGFSGYDDPARLAHWVMTGTPEDIDLTNVSQDYSKALHGAWFAMRQAVGQAEPIIQWRLGQLTWCVKQRMPRRRVFPTSALDVLDELDHRFTFPDERVAALLDASKTDRGAFLRELLELPTFRPYQRGLWKGETFAQLVRDHPDIVNAKLTGEVAEAEIAADALCEAPGDVCAPFAETIAELATAPSKRRRAAGARLAMDAGYVAMAPHLQRVVLTGNASARAEAIRVLTRVAGDEHRGAVLEYCQQHVGDDRSASVREAMAELAELAAGTITAAEAPNAAAPSVVDEGPPTDAEEAAFREIFALARFNEDEKSWRALTDVVWSYLTTGDRSGVPDPVPIVRERVEQIAGRLRPLFVFRLTRVVRSVNDWGGILLALSERFAETGAPTLLEVQAAAESAGFERRNVVRQLTRNPPWPTDVVSAWVLALLPDLISELDAEDSNYAPVMTRYYDVFATVSAMPLQLRQYLLSQAVGTRKSVRPMARRALAGQPDLVESVIELLSSRKSGERAEAADWLGELGGTDAVAALHTAAQTERNDLALGAELAALERLGEPIDPYLDPQLLIERGKKDADKGIPSDAAWFHLDAMPTLRWADGTDVDPRLVEWLVVQAVRLKSASPSPIVSRLFDRMDPASVKAFSNAVFAAWLAEDLKPAPPDEVEARVTTALPAWSREERYQQMDPADLKALMFSRFSVEPAGSAVASKGLLSLASAGADLAVVAPTESYLRKWYGRRVSQAKAMVEMLGWIDDPAATQLLLSIGNRFRTKGIQDEAMRQAELVADRKGWTLDDLAYRTVPTGGFDADGKLVLDFGDRTFEARLTDDLKIVLSDDNGKTIKSLPSARATDDDDMAALAKKELADAKKSVAAAAKEQPVRLHEAMCVQREFSVDDFDRYVLAHPVMGRLATRLVWAAVVGDDRTLFRPLTDGTLLNVDDDEIELAGVDFVTLAHEVIDGADLGHRWSQHFGDFKVTPLFPQFDRPTVPNLADGQTELIEWKGAIIDDRRLRSVIGKLNFVIGAGHDAGIVWTIDRRFVGAGLEAQVSVYGLHATTMEKDVAIQSLSFVRDGTFAPIALAEVPEVLLVETMADVEQLVAAGDGIDPDWETRAAF